MTIVVCSVCSTWVLIKVKLPGGSLETWFHCPICQKRVRASEARVMP